MNTDSQSDLVAILPKAIEFVRSKVSSDFKSDLALVLGSGLSDLARQVRASVVLPYSEIPGMVSAKVSGHKGEMIIGELNQKKVIVLSGRTHFYEGHSMRETTFSIRLVAGLGTKILILTSAV